MCVCVGVHAKLSVFDRARPKNSQKKSQPASQPAAEKSKRNLAIAPGGASETRARAKCGKIDGNRSIRPKGKRDKANKSSSPGEARQASMVETHAQLSVEHADPKLLIKMQ